MPIGNQNNFSQSATNHMRILKILILEKLTQNHMSIHKPSAVCQHATPQSVR